MGRPASELWRMTVDLLESGGNFVILSPTPWHSMLFQARSVDSPPATKNFV
jgi:hypothetical protein